MPAERTARRQEPASCESCRRKKLRCDRHLPCHNCHSRGIECIYHGQHPPVAAHEGKESEISSLRAENHAIMARLKLLEHTVYNKNLITQPERPLTAQLPDAATSESAAESTLADEVRYLELATITTESLPRLGETAKIQVRDLRDIISLSACGDPSVIIIPAYEDAVTLIERYVAHADALRHVLHVPDVQTQVRHLYEHMQAPLSIALRYTHLCLLLSIMANVASWAPEPTFDPLFRSKAEAAPVAKYWLRCCLDIQDHVWRTGGIDLCLVQAKMLLVFLIYHREGVSVKAKCILASAICDARTLSLHMTDSPRNKPRLDDRAVIIDIELRRRIWWHLACTDWTTSLFVGTAGYTILPSQMRVREPRNLTDDDLLYQAADFERPPEETTPTTYYISRITLGHICREVADTLQEIENPLGLRHISYAKIVALDAKFEDILNSMPHALKLDIGDNSRPLTHPFSPAQRQRYFTRLTTEARRCKLHLPWLLRAAHKSEYAFSRQRCLQSARNILWMMDLLPLEGAGKWETVIQHHFCAAIIILAMDMCVHPRAGDIEVRKNEVQVASRAFENAANHSSAAASFLKTLQNTLQKYNVSSVELVQDARLLKSPEHLSKGSAVSPQTSSYIGTDMETFDFSGAFNDDLNFDDMWQSYLELDSYPTAWPITISEIVP